jgi:tetratricopeptide (TPR) repeat protein
MHEWVVAPYRQDREGAPDSGGALYCTIDAHRNHRGPYTAAGGLARRLAEPACALTADLGLAHQLTLLAVAPELRDKIAVSEDVTKAFLFLLDGRVAGWTRRLAHGLTDFILSRVARDDSPRYCVSFDNVEHADLVDWEFIAVLLRRADPRRLLVRVCTATDMVDEPLLSALNAYAQIVCLQAPRADYVAHELPPAWRAWLLRHAAGWRAEWKALSDLSRHLDLAAMPPPSASLSEFLGEAVARLPPAARLELAREYVASDCTSDELLIRHAYRELAAAERSELHRSRAHDLKALNEESLSLGAIPFHHEQAGDDVEPLLAAAKYCMHMDYYEAARDWAARGRSMLDPRDRGKTYVELTRNLLFALLLLGRLDEVETLCGESRSESDPALLAHVSYAMGMLNARYYAPARRDYAAAHAWIEKSLAYTEQAPPSPARTLNLAFLRNTMALVELRQGRPVEAERLLAEAIDYLATHAPDLYETDCAVFLNNRARLHLAAGRVERAIDELTALVRHEPSNSEAFCSRGLLHHRAGRYEEALRDYEAAIKWSPPYTDPHLNRAATLVALGRKAEALAEYDRVLVLEPDHVEALIDRARLLSEQKRFDAAQDDVEHGLRLSPANARMLCVRGLLEQKRGDPDAAYQSFSAAIEADRSLADAWANRATILFHRSAFEAALSDLTQAASLRPEAAILYNRGRVLEAQSRWHEAADDYTRAMGLARGAVPHIRRHRDMCLRAMGIKIPVDAAVGGNST